MNKIFINNISKKYSLDCDLTAKILKILFNEMAKILKNNKKLSLRNFGVFSIKIRKDYITINPATQNKMLVPSCLTIHFKPSSHLTKKISNEN